MRHFSYHAANCRRVRALDHLIEPGEAKPFDNLLMAHRRANHRANIFQPQSAAVCWSFLGRHHNSSAALPRMLATSSRFFSFLSASNVALITLCGLVVPMDFVSTFCTPAEVITARTAPPAITPVPSGAGFSKTMPEPKRPSTASGMLVCVKFTRTRFFLADSMPLRIACGTSFALPEPYPTTAADGSPTTTSAAKDRFLPPFTTLVTRLMATTWSFSWYAPASSFLTTVGMRKSVLSFLALSH